MTALIHAGCFISGLYLEGAEWDIDNGCLVKSRPKVLVVPLPILKVIPTESRHLRLQVGHQARREILVIMTGVGHRALAWQYLNVYFKIILLLHFYRIQLSEILPVLYATEYLANSGVHHLTEEECNGRGLGVRG